MKGARRHKKHLSRGHELREALYADASRWAPVTPLASYAQVSKAILAVTHGTGSRAPWIAPGRHCRHRVGVVRVGCMVGLFGLVCVVCGVPCAPGLCCMHGVRSVLFP